MRTLYGLKQSPWTERARWALDHHDVTYRFHEHLPLVGELLLRRKAGQGKASVPLLVDGREVARSSTEIARYAERIGRGSPLFSREGPRVREVERWDALSEQMLQVGRALALRSLRLSREAQREALPSFVPGVLRGPLASSSSLAVRFLQKKYDVPTEVDEEVTRTLRPALEEIRSALGAHTYLLASFSFADIAVATALQCLRPHPSLSLGPATSAVWTNEALARDFDDLLMWRDALYAKHR
jgi:glutathione S-transferase